MLVFVLNATIFPLALGMSLLLQWRTVRQVNDRATGKELLGALIASKLVELVIVVIALPIVLLALSFLASVALPDGPAALIAAACATIGAGDDRRLGRIDDQELLTNTRRARATRPRCTSKP